jgi:hypothetical protein
MVIMIIYKSFYSSTPSSRNQTDTMSIETMSKLHVLLGIGVFGRNTQFSEKFDEILQCLFFNELKNPRCVQKHSYRKITYFNHREPKKFLGPLAQAFGVIK